MPSLLLATRQAIRRPWRSPALWLAVQLVLSGWFLASTGGFEYRRVPDTASYLETADAESLSTALADYRTIGYPAFLELFRSADGTIRLHRVPAVQWWLYAAAVLSFFIGLARLSDSRWLAFVAATPLVYSPIRLLVDRVQPDFLAAAAVVASFGLLFSLLERSSRLRWIAFGAVVFLSYQLRPAGLFLVGLLPLVGGLVCWLGRRLEPAHALRAAGRIALVTLLPLLAFGGLRWLTVGHFGLVSFGGFNAMGMAACFLDHRLLRELPEEQRPLAQAILRSRLERGYEPMTRADDPREYFAQYSPNIFSISASTAKRLLRRDAATEPRGAGSGAGGGARVGSRPGDLSVEWAVEVNRRLSRLAREIVVRRPVLYLNWVRAALLYGTEQLARWLWIVWPALLLLVLLPIRLLRGKSESARPLAIDRRRDEGIVALTLAGVGLFSAYLLTVGLVSYPFPRYFLSMILLLPSVLTALCFETVRSILPRSGRGGDRSGAGRTGDR
ncbi:MAG: hypothetical protein R3244_02280 [Thermoanaerobaculia bacterium]|nr:hypothetical protein [Thermoanaerobaculia bacterium]